MIVFDGRFAVQVRCYAGCDPLDIIAALRSRGLWDGSGRDDDIRIGLDELRRRKTTPATDPNRHKVLALRIWGEATDPTGTPAHAYLKCRGLELPTSATMGLIRYHARCPKGGSGATAPALIALMCNVETFEPQAIQRLFLEVDELTGFVRKTSAMMLGSVGGAAMMISQREETFWQHCHMCPRLHVCEGLETGLALHQAGFEPVWALGSAGAIGRFPVIANVSRLIICADNDDHNVGLAAAVDCAERWNVSSKATIVLPDPGSDFADKFKGVING